jgi:AraC-like DNA-binding protein
MQHNSRIEYGTPPVTVGKDSLAHQDLYRILLVLRGAVKLAHDGGETLAPARSIALLPPHARLRVTPGAAAETLEAGFGRGALDPAALGREAAGLLQFLGISEAAREREWPLRLIRLGPEIAAEAGALIHRLGDEASARRPGFETMMKLALIELLLLMYRSTIAAGGGSADGPVRFRIEDAVAYVENRYSEELSLAGLAKHFGLNPSYFSRLFARHTGMPLFSFVNRLRIQKSCVLLKRSGLSIIEIAFSVGYNNLSHFNRYFRRIMGESPREYRKRAIK